MRVAMNEHDPDIVGAPKHLEPYRFPPGQSGCYTKGKRRALIPWCKKWASGPIGKQRLKWLAMQNGDLMVALGAVKMIYEYGYGKPSSMKEIHDQDKENTGVAIDWTKYQGEGGAERLKEDLCKELEWFEQNRDLLESAPREKEKTRRSKKGKGRKHRSK